MQPWERFNSTTENPVAAPNPDVLKGGGQPWERIATTTETRQNAPTRTERRNYFINRNPVERFLTQSRGIAKSIPVIGNFVSETPEMREEERMAPRATMAGRNLGGAVATTPLMAAGPVGSTLAKQVLNMGTRGAGLNLADANTSNNPPNNLQEQAVRGMFGFAGGGGGALANRILNPAGFRKPPTSPPPNLPGPRGITPPNPSTPNVPQLSSIVNSQNIPRNASQTTDALATALTNMVAGGALGHLATGDLSGALYGAASGAAAGRAARKFGNSNFGKEYLGRKANPEDAAILNAIGAYIPTLGQ